MPELASSAEVIQIKGHVISVKRKPFKQVGGKYFFTPDQALGALQQEGNSLINGLKTFLKKHSWFYELLRNTLYPVLIVSGKNREGFLRDCQLTADHLIVNIASGNNTLDNFVNVDIFPLEKVDVVASATDLPFEEGSIDVVINETSLEHITDFQGAINETHRILKSGGLFFVTVPFIMGYHDSPSDFWRFTKEGLRVALHDFEIIEIGNKGGIASALGWILAEFVATILSFGWAPLHFVFFHVALALLMPLKLLDFLFVYYPTTSNISSMFYAIAKKK